MHLFHKISIEYIISKYEEKYKLTKERFGKLMEEFKECSEIDYSDNIYQDCTDTALKGFYSKFNIDLILKIVNYYKFIQIKYVTNG